MNEKELLLNKINEKKAQLASSRKGTESWSSSGRKKSGTSQVSKLSVQSLEKEIKILSKELRHFKINKLKHNKPFKLTHNAGLFCGTVALLHFATNQILRYAPFNGALESQVANIIIN